MSKVFNKMHECYAKLYFLDITRTTNVVRIISYVFFNEWIDESMNELINQQSISRTCASGDSYYISSSCYIKKV